MKKKGGGIPPYREFSELLPRVMLALGPRIYGAYGVTAQQFRYLQEIGRGPVTVGDLAARFQAKAPAVTRLLRRLEEKGWIARRPAEGDRRMVLLQLTPEGKEFLDTLARNREEVFRRTFARLAGEEQEMIVRAFRLLLQALAEEGENNPTGGRE